jgi:hypothetical protein
MDAMRRSWHDQDLEELANFNDMQLVPCRCSGGLSGRGSVRRSSPILQTVAVVATAA